MTEEELNRIAEAAAERAVERVLAEEEDEELLLHSLPHMSGSPGIVWDEDRAKRTPCHCTGAFCFSKGVIGTLSKEQQEWACNPRMEVERPGLRRRYERWMEAVGECKARLEREVPTDGYARVDYWLRCMSDRLKGEP